MAAGRARAIREAIIATLARIDGSAPYTFNLTATSGRQARVWTGMYKDDAPPARPMAGYPVVAVRCLGVETNNDGALTEFTHQGTWALDCWVYGNPSDVDDRLGNAEDFFEEVEQAIHSNIGLVHTSTTYPGFTARNLVDRLTVSSTPFTEDLQQQSRDGQVYGRVLIGINCWWRQALPNQEAAP